MIVALLSPLPHPSSSATGHTASSPGSPGSPSAIYNSSCEALHMNLIDNLVNHPLLAGSTGQRGLKQFCVKVASPEQSVPPLAGAGLVQVLDGKDSETIPMENISTKAKKLPLNHLM